MEVGEGIRGGEYYGYEVFVNINYYAIRLRPVYGAGLDASMEAHSRSLSRGELVGE